MASEKEAGRDLPAMTEYVARFTARLGDAEIPGEVDELAKKNILDVLACAMAGAVSEPGRLLAGYAQSLGASGSASILGTSLKTAPRFAALVNGTAMHADDYDDTLQAETGRFQGIHPSAPVTAALLAAGEPMGVSGRKLLTAYQAGVEVGCRLFDATHPNHILHGFHATATCGMLGAAMAVGKLYGSDETALRAMLGIAASQAGGLQENFGTTIKPVHAGRSAECGIVSADWQRLGATASPIILEARRGFFQALGGGNEPVRLMGKLGQPWSFVDRGIWLKAFPTGSLGHPAMTAMRRLVIDNDVKPEQVAKVRVTTSQNIHHTLLHHLPETELQAKFSLEFCLAALLLQRQCGLTQFNDEYVNRPDIQAAIRLVEYSTYTPEQAQRERHTIVTSEVEIILKDGRTLRERADFGKGNKADPMSMDEVADKFRECATYGGWDSGRAEQAIALVQRLETLHDIRVLTGLLAG